MGPRDRPPCVRPPTAPRGPSDTARLLEVSGGGPTVVWMRRLILVVAFAAFIPSAGAASPRADRIESTYGVGDIRAGDKQWSIGELKIVEASLRVLGEEELPGMRGVELVRMRRSPRILGAGLYKVDGEGPRILVYDRAFQGEGKGSSTDPNHTLVHEFGHAIAHKSVRVATRRADRALAATNDLVSKYNAAANRFNASARRYNATRDPAIRAELRPLSRRVERLGHDVVASRKKLRKLERSARALHQDYRSPFPRYGILRDYKTSLGLRFGPTPYGRLNLMESFAESFMLHHVDPAALKKSLPRVHEWFAGEGHLNPRR